MKIEVREAIDDDRDTFIDLTVKLSNFNRNNHSSECKYVTMNL